MEMAPPALFGPHIPSNTTWNQYGNTVIVGSVGQIYICCLCVLFTDYNIIKTKLMYELVKKQEFVRN
jgi:hypothetical protein